MPTFSHPALLWGLALTGVPVLIHLINLVRRRRVAWGAMEFLLAAQQKRRRQVWLQELLLLLLRMLAVAGVVLIVAQPVVDPRWASAWGNARVHHVVLLDDSYSMSDRGETGSAFDRALAVIGRLGEAAQADRTAGTFTLLRFSRAGGSKPRPDLVREPLTAEFPARLAEALSGLGPSASAAGPLPALEALDRLLEEIDSEQRVLYLVSDFRRRDWREPRALLDRLRGWTTAGGELHLVACSDRPRANLTAARLEVLPANLAAGVPVPIEVSVTNWGPGVAREVPVELWEDGQGRPAMAFDRIEPGRTETRRLEVTFPVAGPHTLAVGLPGDAVMLDNRAYAAVDVPLGNPLLVVAADDDTSDAQFLSQALAPGGRTRTGLSVEVQPASRLDRERLDPWMAVLLADCGPLSSAALRSLEEYLERGGQVVVFVGDRTSAEEISQRWWRGGEGFFPVHVGPDTALVTDRLDGAPDLVAGDHPMFRVFAGERNSFLASVNIHRYLPLADPPAAGQTPPYRVLARLRNQAPLVLESRHGAGRVFTVLTSAAPEWNNWARNPSYVVALLELSAELSRATRPGSNWQVGGPLELVLPADRYRASVGWLPPAEGAARASETPAQPSAKGLVATWYDTPAPGIYRAELVTLEGAKETRALAVNLDPAEGDLALWEETTRAGALSGVPHRWHRAAEFTRASADRAGFNLTVGLLAVLAAVLLAEGGLAYRASYHPPPGAPRR